MVKCSICEEESFGYIQWFQDRKKIASYPVCLTHILVAYGLIQLGQDVIRDFLAKSLPIKKGGIPRFKVSLNK